MFEERFRQEGKAKKYLLDKVCTYSAHDKTSIWLSVHVFSPRCVSTRSRHKALVMPLFLPERPGACLSQARRSHALRSCRREEMGFDPSAPVSGGEQGTGEIAAYFCCRLIAKRWDTFHVACVQNGIRLGYFWCRLLGCLSCSSTAGLSS